MCPESLWNVDHQGVLALQSACFDNDGSDARPIPTGRQLLQLYCRLTCATGGLHKIIDVEQQRAPLQVAIASQTRMEVAQMIFEEDPTAIRLTDKDGRLPLHHIMTNQFQSRQLRMLKEKLTWLLQVDPSAAVFPMTLRPRAPPISQNQSFPPRSTRNISSRALTPNKANKPKSHHLPCRRQTTTQPTFVFSRFHRLAQIVAHAAQCHVPIRSQRMDSICRRGSLTRRKTVPTNPCAMPDLEHGNLPLHLAVQNHRHERSAPGLVQGLLQHYPGAILHANHKGQTALQLLLGSQQASSSNNENNNTATVVRSIPSSHSSSQSHQCSVVR
ncbi:expressed unknown protein [Seminavis robusta]|uniref:Uncharacterized protein n=1 Tax=Seminavis robusta TaxID=568900 RepID=A0A9N8E1Y7_9STRA|nr:expressed unknown protein [Seminavis robusta]|eukprot:Sro570_g168510.1 n/a (329) ;mRNA; f:25623-26609